MNRSDRSQNSGGGGEEYGQERGRGKLIQAEIMGVYRSVNIELYTLCALVYLSKNK